MNILLIEDDAGLVKLISTILEESEFYVMSAASGREALAQLKKQIPDMMLLDYSLPDINGKELIETLNKKQIPLPPFIITTGQGDERIAVDMMKLGAKDYLIKDILFLEKLPEVIKRVVKEIESDGKLKQAEEALKVSEERLRGFMDSATDGFLLFDSELNQVDMNDTALKMTQQKRDGVIGKNILQLAPDVEKSGRYDQYKEVIRSGKPIIFNDIMPHSKFGNKHVLLKAFKVGQGLGMIITDISEKIKSEQELKKSESTIRNKLKAITEPEGDIGTLELSDIIDTDLLQSLLEDYCQLTGMLGAILDVSGKVLVAVGWQDICTKFHRCNPNTLKNCIESDTILTQGVPEGAFKAYKCKNNLWDIVTPLVVGGKHVGNVFMGQYLLQDELPDYELFREQARKYGFDEKEYISALDRVPHFSQETVDVGMQFLSKLAKIISTLSYSTIQQSRMLAIHKLTEQSLRESEERFELAMNATKDGLYDWDLVTNEIYYSPSWKNMLGYKEDELSNDFSIWENLTKPEDVEKSWKMQQEVINKKRDRFELEFKMKHKDGHWVDILSRAEAVFNDKGIAIRIVGTHVDISERKHEEKILEVELKMFEYAINHSEEEVLRKFLDEAEKLTNSEIGFYHYVEDDQESISLQTWSTNTLNNMCKGSGESTRHYPISKAGVWVDCVKERKPVIHNDYSNLEHKKGLPEGHATIIRELVVPVIRGNKIKAVLGVGNKKLDYNESDVYSIQRFADVAWETVVRKQAEEDTKKSQLLLQQAEEISDQGAWEWDIVQDEWTFSENWLRIHGCQLSGITREELMTIAYPEDAPKVEKAFKDALEGNTPYNIEHRMVRQNDSEVRYVRASGKIIYNDSGERVKMYGVAQDITERKQAEEKLGESEKFSKEIIKSMSDGFSILDENGVHIDVNLAFCNMTEFAKEELVGVGPPHPYWPEEEYKNIKEAFVKTSQGNFESFELVFKRKNGKRFPVIVSPSQIKDENGYVISSFATVRDITERKRVERELLNYKEHLEETVQERTKELQDKNDELDRAMKVFVGRELKIRELEKRIGNMGKDK